MILDGASDLVQVVTASTGTIEVQASFVDNNAGALTPSRTNTPTITTIATTTVVAAPGVGKQRNVRFLSIRNDHATTSNAITVNHTDGTNVATLWAGTLLAQETIVLNERGTWDYYAANGVLKSAVSTGRFLGTSVLTSASANFTTQASTVTIRIRGVAGGGGGAGCTSVAAAAAAGGGGGGGGYIEKTVTVTPNTAYAYTCGAAGAGASGALGGNGVDSTFVVGATTYTAKGGTGAPVATALTTPSSYKGGLGGTVSTNGDLNSSGEPGHNGHITVTATPTGASGAGGSSPFGAGGGPISAVGNGLNAIGFGGGGGGSMTGASAVRTGGNGSAGCWVVDEFS